MLLTDERKRLIEDIERLHNVVRNLDIQKDIVRKEKLGDANFEELESLFNNLVEYIKRIEGKNIFGVSNKILKEYQTDLNKILDSIEMIKKFNLNNGNSNDARGCKINCVRS
jgi:hypothetical protein